MLLVLIVVGNNHSDICQKNAYQVFFFFPSLFSVLPLELSQSWMKKKLIKKYFNFFVCSVASAKQKYKCCRPKRRTSSNGLFARDREQRYKCEKKKNITFFYWAQRIRTSNMVFTLTTIAISLRCESESELYLICFTFSACINGDR